MDAGDSPSLFANRGFVTLWLGQAASQVGDRVHSLAVTWWVLQKTGSTVLVGQVLLASTLPLVLLAPLGGTLADRWDRRRILAASDLARAAIVLALAALEGEDHLTLAGLLAATMLLSAFSALFNPTLLASVPALVEPRHVMRACSLQDTVTAAAGILGPALGGTLVAALGLAPAFGVNGASFLLAGLATLTVRFPEAAPGGPSSPFMEQMAAGFAYLKQTRIILGMISVFGALNFFATPVAIYLPFYAARIFKGGASTLGWLETSLSLGMMTAGLGAAGRTGQGRKAWPILGSIVASGAMFIALGFTSRVGAALAVLFVMGLFIGVANICILVFFQETIPNDRLGRVMGIVTTVTTAAQPAAYAAAGFLSGAVSVPALAICSGAGICAGALFLLALPGFREV